MPFCLWEGSARRAMPMGGLFFRTSRRPVCRRHGHCMVFQLHGNAPGCTKAPHPPTPLHGTWNFFSRHERNSSLFQSTKSDTGQGVGFPQGDFSAGKIPYFNLVRNFPALFHCRCGVFPAPIQPAVTQQQSPLPHISQFGFHRNCLVPPSVVNPVVVSCHFSRFFRITSCAICLCSP